MHLGHAIKSAFFRLLPFRKKKTGDFLRHRRFKLSIENTNSLQTVFSLRASRMGMWTIGILAFIAIGVVWLLAFLYTPLRNVVPVKMQADLRDEYVDLTMRLDSVAQALAINERYSQNLITILNDSLPKEQTTPQLQTEPLPLDSLLESSEAERSFVRRFEESERFNLSVLSPIAAEGMVFYPPLLGIEVSDNVSDRGIPYITAITGKSTPISAIYRGTVINKYFTTGRGTTLVIQHPNDFVSVYSGLSETFVSRGDKVNAGTRIGLASQDRYPFVFELWHNGSPLPPTDFISFSTQ